MSDCSRPVSTLQKEKKYLKSTSTEENDIIELTDNSLDNSSDLPDTLSPLVKGPREKGFAGSRKPRPPSKNFVPLYIDASDGEGSDEDCILILNDPPGSRRPIRSFPPAKGVVDIFPLRRNFTEAFIDVGEATAGVKENPLLDSPKKNAVLEFSRLEQSSPNKKPGRSAKKAKEHARRQQYATELFVELNKNVFGDRLPKNTTLEWSKRLLTTAGRARWHRSREGTHTTKIELASKILDCDERIRNTLSHEMCHLACWVIDNRPKEGHGQLFKSWANKVMHKHPGIHISTRHNYEITYPYEWKCERCSKIYGRHSKSIRPDECVCGACKAGKLVPLFVERRPMTPKVSRMAVAIPRDSPCSLVVSPIKKGSIEQGNSVAFANIDSDDEIPGLVNALGGICINSTEGR